MFYLRLNKKTNRCMKTLIKAFHIIFIGVLFFILLEQPYILNTTICGWLDSSISWYKLIGYIGILYLLYFSYRLFFCPVHRDWWLANRNYITAIAYLVVFIPFIFFDLFNKIEIDSNDLVEDSSKTCCMQPTNPDTPKTLWGIYYHLVDPGNQHMANSKGKPWAGILAVLGIILFNGLMVSAIVGYVDLRRDKIQNGKLRYQFFNFFNLIIFKKHYIIIGGNDVVSGIVEQLLKADSDSQKKKISFRKILSWIYGKPYILIQTSRDVESFRKELFSTLTEKEQRRIIIYYGNRISKEEISKLRIHRAKEVYIIGEDTRTDDIESYHDTMNMKCLSIVQEIFATSYRNKVIGWLNNITTALKNTSDKDTIGKKYIKPIREWLGKQRNALKISCRVMFEYQTSFSVFQFYEINKTIKGNVDFKPFNYHEIWAQKVLINREIDKNKILEKFKVGGYLPLEGAEGIKENDDSYVHLFIVGMSRMGVAMAIEAAHLCHFPNYETKKIRTKITFIDKNAAEEKDFFIGRFKELFALSHWRYGTAENNSLKWEQSHRPVGCAHLGGDFIDIEWEFINGGIEQECVQDYILYSATPLAKITIAICLPESNRSHAAALYLNKKIYKSDSLLQVLVYNQFGDAIIRAISDNGSIHPYCGKLRHYGYSKILFLEDLELSEKIGEKIDNTYNNIKIKSKYPTPVASPHKGKSKVAKFWSSIYNGNTMWTKLRCIKFNKETFCNEKDVINILANVEHNRWNVEELLMNFRPLTYSEQRIELFCQNKNKNILKSEMAHTDICSNQRLLEIDEDARIYDIELTKKLMNIYNDWNNSKA